MHRLAPPNTHGDEFEDAFNSRRCLCASAPAQICCAGRARASTCAAPNRGRGRLTRTDAPHPAPFSNNSNRCEALNVLSSLLRWRSRRLCSRPRGWRRSMQRHPKRTTRFGPDAPNFQCWRHSRLDSRPTKSNAGDARVEICLAQSAAQDRHRCGNGTHRTTGTRGHANKRTRYRPPAPPPRCGAAGVCLALKNHLGRRIAWPLRR